MNVRLHLDLGFNGHRTDGESIATALDNVIETGMGAVGDRWDEYSGAPEVGKLFVLDVARPPGPGTALSGVPGLKST